MSQRVLERILGDIRSGRLRPGQRLPSERLLMSDFQVGRSTVREALQGLVTLGLLTNRQGRGAIVTALAQDPIVSLRRNLDIEQLNKRALLDLLEVREALEGQVAEFAARRATPQDLQELERHHEAVAQKVRQGRSYFRENTAFHTAVAAAAHNALLAELVDLVIGQVRTYRERLMRELSLMPRRDVLEHQAVLTAIRRRDPERARAAMVGHIRSFARMIEEVDISAKAS